MANQESVNETVGFSLRFDVTTDPDRLAELQQTLCAIARDAGGCAVHAAIDLPETYPPGVADKKLLGSFGTVLDTDQARYNFKVISNLRLQGLHTVRDMLVVGTDYLRPMGGAGDRTITALKAGLAKPPFPIRIHRKPAMHQIVGLCDNLDEVVIQAAAGPIAEQQLVGREDMDNRVTVQDALEDTDIFRAVIASDFARSRAVTFAEAFVQAKEAIA
jgi:hypothetical protein